MTTGYFKRNMGEHGYTGTTQIKVLKSGYILLIFCFAVWLTPRSKTYLHKIKALSENLNHVMMSIKGPDGLFIS